MTDPTTTTFAVTRADGLIIYGDHGQTLAAAPFELTNGLDQADEIRELLEELGFPADGSAMTGGLRSDGVTYTAGRCYLPADSAAAAPVSDETEVEGDDA